MSESEHQRVSAIQERIMPSGKLTAGEVDWLLALGSRPGTPSQQAVRMHWVTLTLASGNHDTVPMSRRSQVFDFATQAVQFRGDDASIAKQGCLIFSELGDPKAIPYLTPLLSSGNGTVSRAARQALHALGKSTQTGNASERTVFV